MKYYEILSTHTETPRNTTRKIANLYIEFNYHFLTLQKKNPITFEQECIFNINLDSVCRYCSILRVLTNVLGQ